MLPFPSITTKIALIYFSFDCILLSICQRCEEDLIAHLNQLSPSAVFISTSFCPCCLGGMSNDALIKRTEEALAIVIARGLTDRKLAVSLEISSAFNVTRIATRTVVTRSSEKNAPFPDFKDLFRQLVEAHLKVLDSSLEIVEPSKAEVLIDLACHHGCEDGESLAMCTHFFPEFIHKKKRLQLGQLQTQDRFEVTQKDTDKVVIFMRAEEVRSVEERLVAYREAYSAPQLRWISTVRSQPVYLLGRYIKLARDVPQAAWSVVNGGDGKNEDSDDEEDEVENETENITAGALLGSETVEKSRKGRNSVEEIVSEAVCKVLKAKICRMHPCGREDIDVRVLGNGRPFALEVNYL